jgi:hypothetical protein
LPFTRLSRNEELGEALSKPGLVDVPLDRRRNVELHRALTGRVSDAVGGVTPLEREP